MVLAATAVTDRGTTLAAGSVPPLQLWAETVGCRVPRTAWEGRVEAVFARACNVELTGGGMITLLAQNAGNVAHGVRLSCSPRLDRVLRPRMPVWLSGDRIGFDNGSVVVQLRGTCTWTPALRPGTCDWRPEAIDAALRADRLLRERAAPTGSELLAVALGLDRAVTPLAARAAEILPGLSRCQQAGGADDALRLIARLIGLGPGLTPAGDDFLVGWLAGVALTARTQPERRFLHTLCANLGALQSATTHLSWQHLDDARALMFSERLSDLGVAIATGAPEPILTTRVEAQLAVGASSGADAAAGLILALAASCPALAAAPRTQPF